MTDPIVIVYKDHAGHWRWHKVARNGETVATSGESFSRRAAARRAATAANPGVPVQATGWVGK